MSHVTSDEQCTTDDTLFSDIPVVSHILTPGSSLHPTFLLIVDGVFLCLLLVLALLLFITGGNVHFIVLLGITSCLWASVKWFVHELKQTTLVQAEHEKTGDTKKNT
ncbi:hypothetical protein BU17DRAFT_60714 [Hysterangium stoloniferum]|nr:hypothetical protein BU17DRAFT_60714 [Hysterangium stoloniferum]